MESSSPKPGAPEHEYLEHAKADIKRSQSDISFIEGGATVEKDEQGNLALKATPEQIDREHRRMEWERYSQKRLLHIEDAVPRVQPEIERTPEGVRFLTMDGHLVTVEPSPLGLMSIDVVRLDDYGLPERGSETSVDLTQRQARALISVLPDVLDRSAAKADATYGRDEYFDQAFLRTLPALNAGLDSREESNESAES